MAGNSRLILEARKDEDTVWAWKGGYIEDGEFSGRPCYKRDTSDNGASYCIFYHSAFETWFIGESVPDPDSGSLSFAVRSNDDADCPQEASWDEAKVQKLVAKDSEDEEGGDGDDLFKDEEFPHSTSSINRPDSEKGEVELSRGEPQWLPARRLRPGEWKLFDRIDPLDLLQGEVGDCWLVSAIAAMAEFPEEVKKLFLRDGFEEGDGQYVIRLFDHKKDCTLDVTVDEYVPCCPKRWWEEKAGTYFAHPHDNELWSILLEKAMAKVFGSYGELNGGTCAAAWRTLTGTKEQIMWSKKEQGEEGEEGEWTKLMLCDDSDNAFQGDGEKMLADELFDHLRKCDGKSYMMAASIRADGEHHRQDGLVEGHCYSLAHVKDVDLGDDKRLRLIDLRNPWGNDQEWNGPWSDGDAAWEDYPEVAEELRPSFGDDGVFWMSFDDFSSIFSSVYVCPKPMRQDDEAAEHAKRVDDWKSLKPSNGRSAPPRRRRKVVQAEAAAPAHEVQAMASGSGAFAFAPNARGASQKAEQKEEDFVLAPGDLCETLTICTVRTEESVLSDIITELPSGLGVQLIELGEAAPRLRARVRAGRIQGWITAKTSGKKLALKRRPSELASVPPSFEEGSKYQTKSLLLVRAGESIDTPLLGELKAGSVVKVLAVSSKEGARRRVKVQSDRLADLEGWVTPENFLGEPLLVPATGARRSLRASISTGTSATAREVLERAKAGDAQGLRKLFEAGGGQGEAPPDVNCTDVRDRTLLMFAAAAGSCETAKFILDKPTVRVNETDDTQKTALHHAVRLQQPLAQGGAAARAELVRMLVAAGVTVDARDQSGCTALMLAASFGDVGTISALVEAGANVNARDYEERNVLSYATSLGREEEANHLMEAGAEDMENELVAPPRMSVSAQRQSLSRPSCRGRASVALSRRRSSVGGSLLCGVGPGRQSKPARQSVLWTSGVAGADAPGMDIIPEVIAVEEVPPTPEVSEEELAQERARAKLEAIMAEGEAAAPVELEKVIAEAEAAGIEGEAMQKAQERVEFLRQRALAHDALLTAIADRYTHQLREAIAAAEEKRVPAAEVDRAKAVLAEEEPKEKAWESLAAAEEKGDTASLKEAMAQAKKAGIPELDLKPFEDLLKGAESKEQAEAALEEATKERDVVALRFALQQARTAGAKAELIAKGEEVLKVEEPLHEARKAIEEIEDGAPLEKMKEVLAKVKEVGLQPDEYERLEEAVKMEEEKQRMLAEVNKALEEVQDVDMQSVTAITEARDKLAAAVSTAMDAGVTEADCKTANMRRRKLHNAIQDLKGAIRVFCRVRPLNKREKDLNDEKIVHAHEDGLSLHVQVTKNQVEHFSFDAVFTPGTQEEVFEEAKDLVQSALDGYNVTIFAYGQTGAGKTFTMYGAPGMEGTAPRTITELYRLVDQGRDRFAYTVMGSMMELYRNDLVDLLVAKKGGSGGRTSVAPGKAQKLNVHMSKTGTVVVDNLTEEECASAEELSDLLERGNAQRTVAATAMNSESSRSHLLVVIQIVCVNRETGEQVRGKILMCDLAGSERLKKSEVTGDMQKEAIEINKSLTALGDVIECLTKGKGHVPYRNHTLTQVMQDALGGTSKTLMFLNCSPAGNNADETLMALKYATRAKKISNDTKKKSQN